VGAAAGALLVTSAVAPSAAVQGQLTWQPSTWTGPAAGPPVPGEGLPGAPMPAPLPPLPPDVPITIEYEPQTTCEDSPKPGALRLEQIIKATYGADEYTWIPRDCGKGGRSEHKEGRAIDWMVDVRDPEGRAEAEAFLAWLLGPDSAGRPYGHALQLGIMYIGWHDRFWRGYDMRARAGPNSRGAFPRPEEEVRQLLPSKPHPYFADLGRSPWRDPWCCTRDGSRRLSEPAPANLFLSSLHPQPPAPPEAAEEGFYGIGSDARLRVSLDLVTLAARRGAHCRLERC
jgi:hypothetical protein